MSNCADGISKHDIAAVFNDCEGNPRVPGVMIPSCSDMETAINNAIPTAQDIAGVFQTCDGLAHQPNTKLPTCADLEAAITDLFPVSLNSPPTAQSTGILTMRVGQQTYWLTTPNAWLEVKGGVIPWYSLT